MCCTRPKVVAKAKSEAKGAKDVKKLSKDSPWQCRGTKGFSVEKRVAMWQEFYDVL
jgi:hypothetical protein